MISAIVNLLKECGLKQISVSVIIVLVLLLGIVVFAGDKRYMLKGEGQQIQQAQVDELEDRLLIMKLREQNMTQEQIDAILKERWEKRLKAIRGD